MLIAALIYRLCCAALISVDRHFRWPAGLIQVGSACFEAATVPNPQAAYNLLKDKAFADLSAAREALPR
jgi:hypothetical protein